MYMKDLEEKIQLRLTKDDMDFLRKVSKEREQSVSSFLRSLIGDYRRGYKTLALIENAIKSGMNKEGEGDAVHGYTNTDINDMLL